MHQPPLRGRPGFAGKRVLLIDPHQTTRDLRASVLQSQGVEVHVAETLAAARCLWRPRLYDWILLDVRRYLPGEALAFYEQIRDASPREHCAFLVGPPKYLSLTWPDEFRAVESETQQWGETVKQYLSAA
jgi:response regulator RpfG family c-di-GMP phosphodiesterase